MAKIDLMDRATAQARLGLARLEELLKLKGGAFVPHPAIPIQLTGGYLAARFHEHSAISRNTYPQRFAAKDSCVHRITLYKPVKRRANPSLRGVGD